MEGKIMIFENRNSQSANTTRQNQVMKNSELIRSNFRTQEGSEIDFASYPYLLQIYNETARYMVLATSRQVGKSTFLALDMLSRSLGAADRYSMFATASRDQLSEIRDDKIRSQFDNNASLKLRAFGKRSLNNQNKIKFSNGSIIFFQAIGHSVSAARGKTAETIYFDEVQSIPRAHLAVVRASAITFPATSRYIFSGTFLSEVNTLNHLFQDSCQYEWIIHCEYCDRDNPPLGMQHIDLDRPYLFCAHCKEPLDPKGGKWVAQNPSNPKVGYRVNILMKPDCQWRTSAHDGVLDIYESEPFDKFLNEILGLPSVAGADLITRSQLESLCSDDPMVDPLEVHGYIKERPSVAAIDWAYNTKEGGASHTMITFAQLENEFIRILFAKRFSGPEYAGEGGPERVIEEILDLLKSFNTNFVFADHGMGHKENTRISSQLQQTNHTLLFEMQYHGHDNRIKWDGDKYRYMIPKTVTLDRVYVFLREGRYQFPRREDSETFYTDIMNVYTEYNDDARTRTYRKISGKPDDFLQLLNLCTIGIMQLQGYPETFTWLR
jgi:hypothetical protein